MTNREVNAKNKEEMSITHICTNDSLLAGGVEIKSTCLICRRKTEHKIGYIVAKCLECGNYYDDDCARTVRVRREFLGLSRQEIADIYGVKKSTIVDYEKWPCEKYWKWILSYKVT